MTKMKVIKHIIEKNPNNMMARKEKKHPCIPLQQPMSLWHLKMHLYMNGILTKCVDIWNIIMKSQMHFKRI
eukprot:CAMPEP_0195254528 /NCGR_PEP_ID=MMETSP0706-20130129/5111_1 /TAXON_ID=33640 /ORGANISM="Asterionellopsis glacialis, Strain CCMP134" /LENGTH=70 /DNA_ID=CAMNT_0040307231 /DNA_START=342 /DNA_END=554 /DNA_ORIENTATION=-